MAWHVRVLPALFVTTACSASVTDDRVVPLGAPAPASVASGSASSPGVAGAPSGTAGAISGTSGARSGNGGTPAFTPSQPTGTPSGGSRVDDRPGGTFHPGLGGGDAGVTPAPPSGVPQRPDASAPPPSGSPPGSCAPRQDLLEATSAGSGSISKCAPHVCAGVPVSTDYQYMQRTDLTPYVGCTAVTGSVVVSSYDGPDLTPLTCLERVDGNLVVWYSPGLTNLHGLESVTLVRGNLGIGYSNSLFAVNPNIAGLDGLSSLRAVEGDVVLSGSDALRSLDGLPSLAAIGGTLMISPEILMTTQPLDLSGLNALVWIGGDLELWRPEGIGRATGLRALRAIGGSFYLWGADVLAEFPALPALECIEGKLDIGDTQFQPDNTKLRRIAPPALRYIGGDVQIDQQIGLEEIDLFATVETVGGSISITGNPKLTTLPVSALRSFGGSVLATNDPSLASCPLRTFVAALSANGWGAISDFTGTPGCSTAP